MKAKKGRDWRQWPVPWVIDRVELPAQSQECLPWGLMLNKRSFWLEQLLVEDSVELQECQVCLLSLGLGVHPLMWSW